jgi:hypothetical protein
MRGRLLVVTLALAGSVLALPGRTAAQGPSPEQAAARLLLGDGSNPLARSSPIPFRSLVLLPDSVGPKRTDHTVTGLLIGAGLGFVGGWVFYNTICEAVDNRCSDSRVRLVVLGTAVGASLGAPIGSLGD